MRPRILITNPLHEAVINFLKRRASVTFKYGLDEYGLLRYVKHHDALIVRSATRVRSCALTDGKKANLRVVATATAGFNHINIETAKKLNVPIIYSPWGNTLANAEFIIGSMIALSRNIVKSDRLLRTGIWDQEAGIGPEISEKVFGTIGFGRIGGLAAEKAKFLGMKVVAYDPGKPESEFAARGVKRVSLKKLLKEADFISFSLPLNETTRGLVGFEELKNVKPSAYIIQSSRGGTINEDALIWLLRHKKLAGAAIDVFENEPTINPALKKLDNVILTPHIGCSSWESRVRSGMAVARGVLDILRGKPVANRLV